jgi:prepilin-type N-terminal cleavage/methylation domain-containing protein
MHKNKGVSLAELSIVIAIIGLVLSAVVGGMGIRKSAEIRGFMSDISSFQVAIEGFDSKYNDLPGDMSDAYAYWTTLCASSGSLATDATRCNGNGDGRIDFSSSDGGLDSESYRSWQHLVLADFLTGGYNGVAATSTAQADIGINVPASKRTKVGYSISNANTGDGNRNEINLGAFYAANVNTNSALTPAEALAIDSKIDDGIPATGVVHGIDGSDVSSGNCFTGSGSSSIYNITVTTFACRQSFPAKP